MECKDRNNRSAIMLPYSFLPSMASKKLQDAADKVSLCRTSGLYLWMWYFKLDG